MISLRESLPGNIWD